MGGMRTPVRAARAVAVFALLLGLHGTGSSQWAGRAEAATSPAQRNGGGGDAVGNRLHDGAKEFGEGLLGGVKFVGRTIISPFVGTTGKVGRDADATGKRLHKGAKGFGEGLLGGAKYAGQKVVGFFNGDSAEKGGR